MPASSASRQASSARGAGTATKLALAPVSRTARPDFFGNLVTYAYTDSLDESSLLDAARAVGMPLTLEDLRDPQIAQLYQARLVLVRPDGHVAWRGAQLPADVAGLVDVVRGR